MRTAQRMETTIAIPISHELKTHVWGYLKKHNIANRGFNDGTPAQQLVGKIGEFETHRYLLGYYPLIDGAYDYNFDLIYNGLTIDVKTKGCNGYMQYNHTHKFFTCQLKHKTDILYYCSLNTVQNVLELCGWEYKWELPILGVFMPKGTIIKLTNGKTFKSKADAYETPNFNLRPLHTLLKANKADARYQHI